MSVPATGALPNESEQGLGQRAAGNTIYIFAGSVVSRLMGLVLVGYLARRFDVAGLGSYNLVVSYVALFSLVADFGVIQYLTREIATRPDDRDVLLRQAATGSLIAGATAFAICNGLALVIGYEADLQRWILIASLPMFLGPAFVAVAVLNAGLRGRQLALLSIANQTLGIVVVLYIVVSRSGIETLITLQALQSFVYAMLIAWSAGVLRVYRRPWRSLPVADGLRMVWAAVPLGAMVILASVYYRLDTFLLSVIDSDEAVGYYSAAWRLTEALHIVPAAIAATILPLAAWKGGANTRRLANALGIAFRFLALVGVPIVVGCMILAKPIVEAVYGPSLAPADWAFRILIVTEIVFFFGGVAATTLAGLRLLKKAFVAQLISVPLNAAACVVLLPRYGYNGAAWISLATELVVVGYLLFALGRALAPNGLVLPWRPTVLATIASAPMAALVLWLGTTAVPLIPTIVAGAALFGATLIAVGGVRREDVRLFSSLRGRSAG